MAFWNIFYGCHRFGEGCKHCFIHEAAKKKGIESEVVTKANDFYAITEKKKDGTYKISSGMVYMCFKTDFLLEEIDPYRKELLDMMRSRPELEFLFYTKRIKRLTQELIHEYQDVFDRTYVGLSLSTQKEVDTLMPVFNALPLKNRYVGLMPLIENVDISAFLEPVKLLIVGGEYYPTGRILDFNWVLNLREQALKTNTSFQFRQCASNFLYEGRLYKLSYHQLSSQAKKANLNYYFRDEE